ncbi:MAG: spermidine/putrescine ABC transporter ATP-binding protein, partial [Planctomycetota bacterium]
GGEAQRVALGRAIAARPAVLLLDEPLSAVDEHAREGLIALLAGLKEERSADGQPVTTLHVTHSRHEAAALADTVLEIHAGEVRRPAAAPARPSGDGRPVDEDSAHGEAPGAQAAQVPASLGEAGP